MNSIDLIEAILERMVELLREGQVLGWVGAIESSRAEIRSAPSATAARIISMYGGMGSLNDVILYSNGQLLGPENSELDALRSELYQLCHEIE